MKRILSIALALIMMLAFAAACAPAEDDNASPSPAEPGETSPSDGEVAPPPGPSDVEGMAKTFPLTVVNDNPAIDGGTLRVALALAGPFAGLLSPVFYGGSDDAEILGWFDEGITSTDDDFVMDQDGPATYTFDMAARTITLTLRPGITWHDGAPVTLDDLLFAYEIICDPDYDGPRWDDDMMNVVGAVEFRSGEADTISGITLSDDNMVMTIEFIEFKPTLLIGGFWTYAKPRHYLGDIPVVDMSAHDKIRANPLGFGPFKVTTVVPGEAVELVRFDDYWRGRPHLDGISLRVIHPDLVPQAMVSGEFDVAAFGTQFYPDYMDPTNYQYIGQLATAFNYTGFNLGWFDEDARDGVGDVVTDLTGKMGDVNLRRAIGYAVDNAGLGEDFYNGLRILATTMITPRHGGYQNTDLAGFYYDPDKARQILDDAGYDQWDSDGFRLGLDGEPLTIYWATMEGAGADTINQFKIQNWADVGLRVELYLGRTHDFNVFYDYLEYDEPGIDMFDAAWNTGINPDPQGLWGRHSWNFPRFMTDELWQLKLDCSSEEAWDSAFRTNAYRKWQEMMYYYAPAIPTLWRTNLVAVNNRVKNYTMVASYIDMTLHLIQLTAEEPYR